MGCLAVVEASHTAPQFKQLQVSKSNIWEEGYIKLGIAFRHVFSFRFQETYGSCDLEAESVEGSGWFTEDPTEISARCQYFWAKEKNKKIQV